MLASTVGHELNHVYHFVSGAYNNWIARYGKLGREYAFARSEYIAQRWEVRNGGFPSLGIMNDNYNLMISIENPVRIKR